MNAQQTTSLVNLISAQPAKPASSAQPDTNAPRFSEVLGNQRSQQPKPSQNAQNKPTDSANAASQPVSEARPSSESSTTSGNDQARQAAATQQNGSNPGTEASTQANAGAAVEPPAENATAMAMSDLAAAVAQVFLNRTTQANTTLDAQDNEIGPITGRRPGADLNLAGSELPGKASADLAMRSGSNANTATEGQLKSLPATEAKPALNPASEAPQDPILTAQSAREPGNTRPAATVASLNQRANALDREARLNAIARDTLAGPINPRQSIDPNALNALPNRVEANPDAVLSAARVAAPGALTPSDTQQPLPVAGNLAESSIAATPASLNLTPGSVSAPMVSTPLGHPQWGNDFSQQVAGISQSLKNGQQTIEMRLDPPDLGPIRISLSLNDGVAQALFVSPHANVRNAVENALPQLQQQLAQAGISLGQTSVSDQNQAQQQASGQSQNSGKSNNSLASTGVVAENALPAPELRAQSTHNGQINTFA